MSKKVLILTASPNPCGNSRTMAKEFAERATELQATCTWHHLAETSGEGCRSCEACRTTNIRCVIQDSISDILQEMHDADVIVIAAPVWFFDLPASIRRLIERCHSLITSDRKPRLPPEKKGILLLSQGASNDRYQDIPTRYTKVFSVLGVQDVRIVRHCDAHVWPVDERIEILDDVRDVALAVLADNMVS